MKKEMFPIMWNLQTNFHLNLDFQNLNQHTVGKWLIQDRNYYSGDLIGLSLSKMQELNTRTVLHLWCSAF